jgi:hypothetical protein
MIFFITQIFILLQNIGVFALIQYINITKNIVEDSSAKN